MHFENPLFIILHVCAFSFAMSLALSGFMLSAGLLDAPVARSNHENPVPTAGGIGLVGGLGIGLLAAALFYPSFFDAALLGQVSALALGAAFLGFLDDVYELGAKLKLAVLLGLVCACVFVVGAPSELPFAAGRIALPAWVGFIGAALWIIVVVNAVNFIDGINGMMGGVMLAAFVGLTIVSLAVGAFEPAVLSALMAAGLAGFLPYNARKSALIFSGDVGALLTGFVFAAASLMLVVSKEKYGLLYAAPLLILPILTDVILTVVRRARRKENVLTAHKSHIYQRLVQSGRSHIFTAWLYCVAVLLMCVIVLAGIQTGLIHSVFFLSVWICALSVVYIVLDKKLKP